LLLGAASTVAAASADQGVVAQELMPQAPLASWNEGEAKQAVLDFVRATTNPSSRHFVVPEDRIATFDQDGTLWVEHPLYTQAMFALDRVRSLVSNHPEWRTQEPFSTVLSNDLARTAQFSEMDWADIVFRTHAGMSEAAFREIALRWIATAKHPRFKRHYTELIYQPMIELLDLLQANQFETFIVTGGGQDFVRSYSQRVYGIPTQRVIGSSIATKLEIDNGVPEVMRLPKLFFKRQLRRQGDRDRPIHRPAPLCRLRKFHRGPADAGMDRRGRRRPIEDAGLSRRSGQGIRLRSRRRAAGHGGRHFRPVSHGRGKAALLDGHQHEERLEAYLRLRVTEARRVCPPI
jgi:phosphoglycolate phosphatase-like HAD superfamily hydrolase